MKMLRQIASQVLILVSISLVGAVNALAGTLYVDDDAPQDPGKHDSLISDPAEDGSSAHPFDSVAEALGAAASGDSVLLLDGVYSGVGNNSLTVKKNITIESEHGATSCVLDCLGASGFTLIGPGDLVLRGITVTQGSAFSGGALRLLGGASARVESCVFDGNLASAGGAIYVENSSIEIENCVFTDNLSANAGGALAVRLGSTASIRYSTFTGNIAAQGGALFAGDSSQTSVDSSVLWDNTAPIGAEISVTFGDAALLVASSDVRGGMAAVDVGIGNTLVWGPGNLNIDPAFVDPAASDVHLRFSSPVIGMVSASPATPELDYEGDPRPLALSVDMGADQFHRHLYVVGDKTPGGQLELKLIGTPNTGPLLLLASLGVLDIPVNTAFGPFFLEPPLLPGFPLALGSLPPTGVLSIPATLPGSALPIDISLQAVIGAKLSNLEVLTIR